MRDVAAVHQSLGYLKNVQYSENVLKTSVDVYKLHVFLNLPHLQTPSDPSEADDY